MLVPFEINQAVASEFNIPVHILDWQRIRILKEIDDIRYSAMVEANIDLSMESLKQIKLYKLAILARPRLDSTGSITSVDPISYAYDISREEIIEAWNEIIDYVKTNKTLKAPNLVKSFNPDRFNTSLFRRRASDLSQEISDAIQMVSNYSQAPGIFIKAFKMVNSNKEDEFPNFYFFSSLNNGLPVEAPLTSTQKNYLEQIYTSSRNFFYEPRHKPSSTMYPINQFEKVQMPGESVKIGFWSNVEYDWNGNIISSIDYPSLRVFDGRVKFPRLLNIFMIQADIEAGKTKNKLIPSMRFLFNAQPDAGVKVDDVVVQVPNPDYNKNVVSPFTLELVDPKGVAYQINVQKTHETFPAWFQRRKFLLGNGKSYIFPFQYSLGVSRGPLLIAQSTSTTVSKWPFARIYSLDFTEFSTTLTDQWRRGSQEAGHEDRQFVRPESLYNFGTRFPYSITLGEYKVRNGYLYADANNFYELTFYQFPDNVLEKLETLISLQYAILSIHEDVESGEWLCVVNGVERLLKDNRNSDNSHYYEFGVKNEFRHPVSLKQMSILHYLSELIFEASVAWNEAQSEINKFFSNLQQRNNAAYNSAYQNFLRGAATIKGPEQLAEYEKKLQTGFFYHENGFDYWRPFSELEVKLINKLVADQNQTYEQRIMEASFITAPTIQQILDIAKAQEKYPTTVLAEWAEANPNYVFNNYVADEVDRIGRELTEIEEKVATAMVADQIAEIEFTKALMELFTINE